MFEGKVQPSYMALLSVLYLAVLLSCFRTAIANGHDKLLMISVLARQQGAEAETG